MTNRAFPQKILPLVDSLAFNPDWVDTFYREFCAGCHNVGPLEMTDYQLDKTVDALVARGLLEVLETRSNKNRRIGLTRQGGKAWESCRNPDWNSYADYSETVSEPDGTQRIQIVSISASVCWGEIIKQINFGRINPSTFKKAKFEFDPSGAIVYWKKNGQGVFVLSLNHSTEICSTDSYWESHPLWRDTWKKNWPTE